MAKKKKQKKRLRRMAESIVTGAASGIITWFVVKILDKIF